MELTVVVNGEKQTAYINREPVVAWAIETSKGRNTATIERIVPLTVEIGFNGFCRSNAMPDIGEEQRDCVQFTTQYDMGGGTGSVRFIPAEPGVRLVTVYVESGTFFDLGIEYPGAPIEVDAEFVARRAEAEIEREQKREKKKAAR